VAILANRVKIKNNLLELGKFTIVLVRRFFAVILISLACYLMYFSAPRPLAQVFLEMSGKFLSVGASIYQESIDISKWLYGRLSYFKNLEEENLRLKDELASLENIRQIDTDIKLENSELRKILNVTKELKRDFVSAKIVGTAITPFASSATIQAGAKDGVNINDIARGKYGLVGRVSEVSDNYSTIILNNDHNSRIPVITSNSKIKGILAKQGDNLKMIYLPEEHNIEIGELVYTSGDGKIYPKGIATAVITNITNEGAFLKSLEDVNDLEFVVIELKTLNK